MRYWPQNQLLVVLLSQSQDIDLHRQRIFKSAECTDANITANIRIRLRSLILIFAIIFGVLAPVVVFVLSLCLSTGQLKKMSTNFDDILEEWNV